MIISKFTLNYQIIHSKNLIHWTHFFFLNHYVTAIIYYILQLICKSEPPKASRMKCMFILDSFFFFFTRIQLQCIMHSKSKPNTSLKPKNSMADKTLHWETTWEIVLLWHSQFYCTPVIIHDSISVPHLRFLENSLGSLTDKIFTFTVFTGNDQHKEFLCQ